jgi:mannose-1-phosphate guanylyltransferase
VAGPPSLVFGAAGPPSLGFGVAGRAAATAASANQQDMITQAFVLGAGLGMRLRPLTDDLPKPLIPIFQKPLITFALDHLCGLGVESFVVNTHHRPERFTDVFGSGAADGPQGAAVYKPPSFLVRRFVNRRSLSAKSSPPSFYRDRKIIFQHEPVLLGTGGGIKNVEGLLRTEPFIVYSGDLLTDFALEPLIDEHFRKGNDVTLALRKTGLATGVALQEGRVVDIENKYGHPGEYDFANVSVWNREIFQRIPPAQSISFIPILAEWIGQGGKLGGVVLEDGKWFNIGSRAEYLEVHRVIQEECWKPDYVSTAEWPVHMAADAAIDPSARLSGFYSVGAACRVGANAILENTILWPGAQIASGCHLRNCIVRFDRKAEGEHSDTDI